MADIVCLDCRVEYLPETNGVIACQHASFGPYKLYAADRLKCPVCNSEVLAGFSREALFVHHEPGFKQAYDGAKERGTLYEFFPSIVEVRREW